MSTILKALKRIDQTTPPPDDLQSWPPRIDTKKAVKGRLYRIWLYRKVVMALIVGVVVIVAGWLVYSQKDLLISKIGSQNQSEKPPVFQAKIAPSIRQSEKRAPQKTKPLNRQMTTSGLKSEPAPVKVDRSSGKLPGSPQRQQNQTNRLRTSTPKARAPEAGSTAKSSISRKPVPDAKSSNQRKTQPLVLAPTQKSKSRASRDTRSYQRLDNSKLKLQAIAWSNDAAQRIAVINDRIVREGESIEGFSVNQIRQDDVVVSDGNQSWQLEFGLR